MGKQLYVDYMSQPSRACIIFSRLHDLPVTMEQTLIHKGQTRSKEYKAINPFGKVPCLVDSTAAGQPFSLPESAAILSYLARQHADKVPEHWYPRASAQAQARVDAALHWYQGNIRAGCARLAFHKVLAAKLGVPPNEAIAQEGLDILKIALQQLETIWLGGSAFVAGSKPCVADLLMVCEIEQLTMLNKAKNGVDLDELLAPWPRVRAWMAHTARACAPHYEEAHALLRKAAAAGEGCASPALAVPSPRL